MFYYTYKVFKLMNYWNYWDYLDFRFARVRVRPCDGQIPPLIWLMYCDQDDFWSRYDVLLEIEHAPLVPQPPPPSGGGSEGSGIKGIDSDSDNVKGNDRWNDPGAGSSTSDS
jgi:hypothetical protein